MHNYMTMHNYTSGLDSGFLEERAFGGGIVVVVVVVVVVV